MKVREAARLVKTLADQYSALARTAEALTLLDGADEMLDGLLQKKNSLESTIKERQEEIRKIDSESAEKFERDKADREKRLAGLNKQLEVAEQALAKVTAEQTAALSKAATAMQDQTATLLNERRQKIDSLDGQIKSKTDQLNSLTAEIEKIRKRMLG